MKNKDIKLIEEAYNKIEEAGWVDGKWKETYAERKAREAKNKASSEKLRADMDKRDQERDQEFSLVKTSLEQKMKDPKIQELVELVHGIECKQSHDPNSMWACDWSYVDWNSPEPRKVQYAWTDITLKLIDKLGGNLSALKEINSLKTEISNLHKQLEEKENTILPIIKKIKNAIKY